MAAHVERPIVFPLSNPTALAEAAPEDVIAWTEGRAIVATGSPFDPVEHKGKVHKIAQCNNSYIFPGVGLGVIASRARRVTETMLIAASEALADSSPGLEDSQEALLPPIDEIRSLSKVISGTSASSFLKASVCWNSSEK